MDTRNKILTPQAAIAMARAWRAEGRRLAVVSGHFDVLLADHLPAVQAVRNGTAPPVVVVVLAPPANPVLRARARAEMVAALAMVDYVIISDGTGLEALLDALAPDETVRVEAAHERRAAQLIEHVQRRTA